MKTYYTDIQKEKAKLIRESYMMSGQRQAKKNDVLHIKGCMLYWAEGSKNSNLFGFTNCDVEANKMMLEFLRKFFPIQSKKIKVRVNFYPSETNTYEKVKQYWKNELNLTDESFNKFTDRSKYYNPPKHNKYPNGILNIQINSTEVANHIFGAINHYVGKNIYTANQYRYGKQKDPET